MLQVWGPGERGPHTHGDGLVHPCEASGPTHSFPQAGLVDVISVGGVHSSMDGGHPFLWELDGHLTFLRAVVCFIYAYVSFLNVSLFLSPFSKRTVIPEASG